MHKHTDPSLTRPEYLNMQDIQRELGVGRRTVQKWRAAGQMPPADFAIGKTLRWRRDTIDRWVRAQSEA